MVNAEVSQQDQEPCGSRFTFCVDLRDVASRIPPLLVLRIFSLSLSLLSLRSSLPRKPLHHGLRSPDNGGLALSSWFIASFDCQVHVGESTRPHPLVCARRFLSYASSPTSTVSLHVARHRYVSLMKLTVTMCARDRSYELGPQPCSILASEFSDILLE